MKKILTYTVLLTSFAAFSAFIKFDDDIIKKITTQLAKWVTENPQEKVYLQLDKPYYAAGDDIWFKAYITLGGDHRLSNLSGVLNVELINNKDSLTKAIKLPIIAGMAWGDFKLADSLIEGNYHIRAYTNYMLNAGEEYFFDKTIQVGNSISGTIQAKPVYTLTDMPNGQQNVNAVITYSDVDGNPYAGKEVNYNIQVNSRQLTRGKGVTNDKGSLNISFVNPSPASFKNGNINTYIEASKDHKILKTIPFGISSKVNVQFFPESGSLVNGIRSRVAFKAVGPNGLGADIKGMLVDDQNNEVAELGESHFGMGDFAFTPNEGKSYSAKIVYADGTSGLVALPKAIDEGYVLSVYNNQPEFVTAKVSVSAATLKKEQNNEINLVAISGGNVVFAAKNKLTASSFSVKIPKSRFISGIAQLTLFSAGGEPLNERILFIQNDDQLKLSLSTAKAIYAPREKVDISISTKNKENQPVTGCYSVSVIDEDKVQPDETEEGTIFSTLLLTSDIKGYIEKPNYYFTNVSDKTKSDLDVLMLTQGYRRFSWKKIMNNDFAPLTFQPEKSLSISGYVRTSSSKPIPQGKVTLFTTAGGAFLLNTVADANGKFVFDNLTFPDSVKFVVQARTSKNGKNVEVVLDNLPSRIARKTSGDGTPGYYTTVSPGYLQNNNKKILEEIKFGQGNHTIMLNEVNIQEKKKPIESSSNLNGPGNADQVLLGDQAWMDGCPDIQSCLNGRLNGVVFKAGIPFLTGGVVNFSGTLPMLVIIDGIQLEPDEVQSDLTNLNPTDIQSIEVLKNIAYTVLYGARGAGGVLVFTTKQGGAAPYQRYAPGLITYRPAGFYKEREFYSPQYNDPKNIPPGSDLRTTIFWKPNIITDKNGSAAFQFFNGDNKGTYRVVIEGIDNEGNLGHQVFRYKVE